jgi:F420-0:gamma-glutamyl ligase
VKVGKNVSKDKLIMQEAEAYIPPSQVPNGEMFLTIKEYILVPVAGIDESNGNGYYILWPKQSSKLAKEICGYLKQKHHIKKLAVIVTDSHTTPLRYGVTGISLGFFGLEPLYDYRGKPDIFGRKLKFTKSNIVDALSALAVLAMGEGKEQTPMAIIRGANFVQFTNRDTYKKLVIPPTLDIYSPLLKVFKENKWKKRK